MEAQLSGQAKRLEIVGSVCAEVKSNNLLDAHLFNQRRNSMNNDFERLTSEIQVINTLRIFSGTGFFCDWAHFHHFLNH